MTGSPRSRLRAVASILVAGTFTIAASAAAGLEPANPTPIPDSAFGAVVLPQVSGEPGASGLPGSPGVRSLAAASPELRPIVEPALPANLPQRPQPRAREPKRIVVDVQLPTTHLIHGNASWYCRAGVSPCTYTHPDAGGFDAYAAAGPGLRAAIGPGWRGTIVYVDGIAVKLIDWCQCYRGEPHEKLLDLYYDVYRRTGTAVTIRW